MKKNSLQNTIKNPINLLFSFKGRITRKYFLLIFIFYMIGTGVLWDLISEVSSTGETIYFPPGNSYLIHVITFVALSWIYWAAYIKRMRDTENPIGFWVFLNLVPVFNIFTQIYALTVSSSHKTIKNNEIEEKD